MSVIEVGFNAEARNALIKFAEAKALAKQAEEMKAEAEAILRAILNGNTEATIGGAKAFKLESRKTSRCDSKQLQEQFPEAYEATLRVTEYDFIKAI